MNRQVVLEYVRWAQRGLASTLGGLGIEQGKALSDEQVASALDAVATYFDGMRERKIHLRREIWNEAHLPEVVYMIGIGMQYIPVPGEGDAAKWARFKTNLENPCLHCGMPEHTSSQASGGVFDEVESI